MEVERRRRSSSRWSPEPDMASVTVSALQLDKLDLFNYDSAAAWDSPVVLTSPRSLAACRRAGVKPVELLYRSEQEVLASLPPDVPLGVLQAVHRRAEDERQAKLHACRAIRHHLIQREQQPQARDQRDQRDRSVVFTRDLPVDDNRDRSSPGSALVGPLFPAKREILRPASPGAKRGTFGVTSSSVKREVLKAATADMKRDVLRTPSPESKVGSFRASSPEIRKDVHIPEGKREEISPPPLPAAAKRDDPRTPPAEANRARMITFSSQCSPPSGMTRKDLLDKENAARVESRSDSRQGSRPESRPESLRLGLAISPNMSAATSPARSVRSQRSTPASDRPRTVLVDCWGHAKSVAAQRHSSAPGSAHRRPPRPPSSGTPSTLSESRCSSRRSRRRSARPPGSRVVSRRSLLRGLRGAVPSATASSSASCLSPRKAASVAVTVQDCDSGRGSSTFALPSAQSMQSVQSLRLGTGTTTPSDLGSWMPGSVLGSVLGTVLGDEVAALAVPEHDRRILESLAMKKQQERRSEDLAHRAHLQWERERRQRHQMEQERAAKWQASVNARREWEAKENGRRMEAVKRSLRLSQQRLEESIRLKEERLQLRVLEEDVHRMVLQGERSKEYAARRLEVEEKLLHIQEGERSYRRLLDAELQSRQAQADRRRERAKEQERLRAASANREWERCRVERTSLLELQAEESVRVLRASARERHQRAANNKSRIRRRRQQRTLHASLEREAKHSDARAMHADLEHGLQLWRERCAALREGASLRAQERAREQREHTRARLHRSNQRRRRHHRALHARVLAEEEGRRRAQRCEVRDKDQRIRQLRRLRERAVQESREQAFATASLREELRRALSPETFDRKAARVQLEMRVSTGRACTASLSPVPSNRSHIHLG